MNNWQRTIARSAVVAAALLLAAAITRAVYPSMTLDGVTLADVLVVGLMFLLTSWLSLWFAVSCVGFVLELLDRPSAAVPTVGSTAREVMGNPSCKTAVLMPVYNEDPGQVYPGVQAMRESIAEAGLSEHFHFFILSDTTDPDTWVDEERHWQSLDKGENLPRVFYRHRPRNIARKAGNIADFCTRWGAAYRYMVVLDADSLMEAGVLAEMVRRMEADHRLGILQTPPMPLGQLSLMSRSQQFIARLCGPMLSTGLGWLAGDGSNYWGHNAIIRTSAFTRYCGLSELPGVKPLGGEILSHDFVEAALMRRAGYKVQLASDLAGSYEQSPSTLTAYAQRDQRWCQGNLQHTRLIASKNIPLENRFHFLTGVLAYGASPLLVLFLVLSPLAFYTGHQTAPGRAAAIAAGVFAVVLTLLFLPRLLAYILAVRDRRERVGFGGPLRLAISTIGELALSVLLAPVLMTFHTLFVWSTLRGKSVEWSAQDRSGEGLSWGEAWRAHRWQSVLGVAVLAITLWMSPALALWLLPITLGLILAVPLSVLVSSKQVGMWLKQRGWLTTPEERHRPSIVRRYHRYLTEEAEASDQKHTFLEFLRDAGAVGEHLQLLEATSAVQVAQEDAVASVRQWLKSPRTSQLSRDEKWAVLSDPQLLETCHVGVWTTTSV